MTTKDFFRVVIKLFALYSLVITIFSVLPSMVSFILADLDWLGLFWITFVVGLMVGVFGLLIAKSDSIIDKLKLDRGFDSSHIPVEKLDASTLLKVGCIVVGGLVFLQHIPPFLSHGYTLIKAAVPGALEQALYGHNTEENKVQLAINAINLAVSYLLLTNYKQVSAFLLTEKDVS